MRKAFLDYLATEGVIAPHRVDRFQETLRAAPEPIGAIAFSYGMITGGDIDDILDEQRHDTRPFGEIAMSKGLLKAEQLRTLLRVQQMRAACEAAEALALSGICLFDDIVSHLGRFLCTLERSTLGVS